MSVINSKYIRKLDPMLSQRVQINNSEPGVVILYANGYEQCREQLVNNGFLILKELPLISGYIVQTPDSLLEELASFDSVSYIAADIDVRTQINTVVKIIRAEDMYRQGITGKGVGIAIVDTGISPHPDFLRPRNRLQGFVDFMGGRRMPYDDNGHGTFVAGVAAGNGYASKGMYGGVAPEASIYAIKAMDKNGAGTTTSVMKAMQWIADNRKKCNIQVASFSIGSSVPTAFRADAMVRGVEALWNRGVTVVVAAGNEGPSYSTITVPGTSSKIITVGSCDDKRTVERSDDTIANFSGRGPVGRFYKPDIVAPGVNIVGTCTLDSIRNEKVTKGKYYTIMSGTSVSTPIVAGMAALILQKHPDYPPDEVKRELMNHTYHVTGDRNKEGWGVAVFT